MDDIQFVACGPHLGPLVRQIVEETLPDAVLAEHGDSLFFLCMASRDGVRLSRHVRENFEVIVLSDHIAPNIHHAETDPVFRYFMYVILHEVAHAICKHKSQYYDGISAKENEAQEVEADALATEWFNERAHDLGNPAMTAGELAEHEARNQQVMQAAWWG